MEIFKEVKVFKDLDNLSFTNPVVTMGVFDGLHKGHQELVSAICRKSKEIGGESIVITFWPHPRIVLDKTDSNLQLLSTLEEKEYLFGEWGLDNLIILPFTKEFALMDGGSFIREVLVEKIGVKFLVIGDDHRFGYDRAGGKELLSEMGELYGFEFENIESRIQDDVRISSSLVREALKSGNLKKANKLLGFPYFMFGKVVEGSRLGRKIGFPTANIECCADKKLVPEEGVYVVEVEVEKEKFGGMLNIGTRPTVDSTMRKSIEVHIFDIDRDLYGKTLKVSFLYRLRNEMKFNGTDELRAQLVKDKAVATLMLSGYEGQKL